MARLFFTLYLGLLGAVFSLFFTIDYLSTKHFYNEELEDARRSVEAYNQLFAVIYRESGEEVMMDLLRKVIKIENLLLEELSPEALRSKPELTSLGSSNLYIDKKIGHDFSVYIRIGVIDRYYKITPDKNASRWRSERTLANIYLFGFFFVTAFILGGWIYLLQRKLKVLEKSARGIAGGDFSIRVPEQSKYRVGGLNVAFNQMAQRIEMLIASHKRLTNAVAHELRTPIFRLRCQSELLDYNISETEHDQYIEGIEEDLTELDQLVDEMLSYARMERSEEYFELKRQELTLWLTSHRSLLARSCKKNLTIQLSEDTLVYFDSRLLMRALSNLVRNADIHAKNEIEVSYSRDNNFATIWVDDDGVGIPENDRDRILEPFERLDDARTRRSGGHGLGLSIVREIASQHGGKVVISQSPLGGARVGVCLPLPSDEKPSLVELNPSHR